MDTFAKRIQQRLSELDMSLEQAAALIGVSWQSVQQWANGSTHPRRNKEARIAEVLQCSREWLFYGESKNVYGIGLSDNCHLVEDKPQSNADQWPFKSVTYARIAALPSADRQFIEGILKEAVIRCEESVDSKRKSQAVS